MSLLAIDIETFSDVDLPKCGVYAYTNSPQFQILLFAYAFDDEPTQVVDLARGEQLPDRVLEALEDETVTKTAFNAAFERTCISRYLGRQLSPASWQCTAVQSAMPDFMAGLARGIEQSRGAVRAAIGSVADDLTLTPTITATTSGLEALRNGGMAQAESATAVSGNSEMAARLDAMYEVVTKYLPRLANRQIVLDSGTLVGELSDGMNRTLGRNLL